MGLSAGITSPWPSCPPTRQAWSSLRRPSSPASAAWISSATSPRRREQTVRPEDKPGVLSEYGLNEEQGNEIIMAARAHWFEDEAPSETGEDAVADTSR